MISKLIAREEQFKRERYLPTCSNHTGVAMKTDDGVFVAILS